MRKKRAKKYKPYVKKRMTFIEVDLFLEPFETFIKQIESDSVWVDGSGRVLMDLFGEITVEDAVRKGEKPLEAIPNLSLVLETYYQVCRLSATPEFAKIVDREISEFRRKILKPLDVGTPIQLSSLVLAKDLLSKMRSVFLSATVDIISNVYVAVIEGLDLAKAANTSINLREWLATRLPVTQ